MSEISLFSPSSVEWMLIRLKLSRRRRRAKLRLMGAMRYKQIWKLRGEMRGKTEKSSLWMRRYRNFERTKLLSFRENFWLRFDFIFFGIHWLSRLALTQTTENFLIQEEEEVEKKSHTNIDICRVGLWRLSQSPVSISLHSYLIHTQVRVSTDSERSLMCREMLKLSLSLSEDLSLFEDCCRCRRYLLPFTLPPRQSQSSVALIMTHQVVSGRNRLFIFCLKFPLWLGLNWPATDRSDLDSFARCHKFARLSWSWLEVITYGQSEKY